MATITTSPLRAVSRSFIISAGRSVLNNHCLIVDFPPRTIAGFRFNLSHSCSAQRWAARHPAGVATLDIKGPARIDQVLLAICRAIPVEVDTTTLRA